jgi:hypothetical protein
VATALILLSREHEPTAQGHRLSYWVERCGGSGTYFSGHTPEERNKAQLAIQQVGTNALPFLMRWTDYQSPQWKLRIYRTASRLPQWIVRRLIGTPLLFDARLDKAEHAAEAFTALGEMAAPAIHELEVRSQNSESLGKRRFAFLALSHIRPTAFAAMSRVLAHPNLPADFFQWDCIRDMGTNAQPLVPTLVHNLDGTNPLVVEVCAQTLGYLALEPDLSIPALTNKLAHPDKRVRVVVVGALGDFGPRALPALPQITNSLSDSDILVRLQATNTLRIIAETVVSSSGHPHLP